MVVVCDGSCGKVAQGVYGILQPFACGDGGDDAVGGASIGEVCGVEVWHYFDSPSEAVVGVGGG